VLTLLIPLSRIGPPLFRWQLERKIYLGYREVRDVERIFAEKGDAADRDALLKRLDRLTARASAVHVPLSYARPLYDLRQHIAFVRGAISGEGSSSVPRAESRQET
jgi:hypothetical protein